MLARGYTGHLNTMNPHILRRVDYVTLAVALFILLIVQWVGRL
jgi:energy-coupling factor transporter transmembrane protein EcfT